MYHSGEQRLRAAVLEHLLRRLGVEPEALTIESPPSPALGEYALPLFDLARRLRRSPRQIAQELAVALSVPGALPSGIARAEPAGGGYLNFFVDRGSALAAWRDTIAAGATSLAPRDNHKVIVEHTNINPNKSAHIGHLRNAVLGDTWVRLLRRCGHRVEVQNYIDNTGVQVADVAVAFEHLEHAGPAEVVAAAAAAERRRGELAAAGQISSGPQHLPIQEGVTRADYSFDYECWDLYTAISEYFQRNPSDVHRRADALHAIESGAGPVAELGAVVADAIVTCHLRTMARIGVAYDVLPRESEILREKIWDKAFHLLIERDAIRRESEGKNKDCWVMARVTGGGGEADDKVIVRSNGTVTYVGKDIAYQLWKFGLLDAHLRFQRHPAFPGVWWSQPLRGDPAAPPFGRADWVFNVIDVRQSYLQEIVASGLRALGYEEQAGRSVHFSYEMVALTPACVRELGLPVDAEDAKRPWLEVSGRRGIGIKADDLIDILERRALAEVEARHPELPSAERLELAVAIAVGALRFFLLRYTRTSVIAFDFREALSFEGETGPYVQYAAVRAGNILRKAGLDTMAIPAWQAGWSAYLADSGLWELAWLAGRLDAVAAQCVAAREPAHLAKYAFQLAQNFSNFYHHYPVLQEPDPDRRAFLLLLVALVRHQLASALELMGIATPAAM